MAITYEWVIETIDTAKSEDGMSDVAKQVHWRMNAHDDTDDLTPFHDAISAGKAAIAAKAE